MPPGNGSVAVSPGSFIGSVETSLEEGDKWLSSKTVGYLQESQALGTSRGPGQQPLTQV